MTLAELMRGSSLGAGLEDVRGRSVLVVTADQLPAALAVIELDGIARRIVLLPPDVPAAHAPWIMRTAAVDCIVTDGSSLNAGATSAASLITASPHVVPANAGRIPTHDTEWILLTSGTTGVPKLVVHTFSTLTAGIRADTGLASPAVWSTFYDIRRYGGLQILLRALVTGGSLVLSSADEPTGEFLARAGAYGVTHISGTPSHWRRALMSPAARSMTPRYVRLSGEIADQSILDHLRSVYPEARVAHAFASTEAGLAFAVGDGLEGFPASLIGGRHADVELNIDDGTLRIRSTRTAVGYLGGRDEALKAQTGFVDTGDIVERRGDRYYFVGRRGGVINVGGLKVHPEEVEAVINRHPRVRMSLVRTRKNAITGALVVADVVLRAPEEAPRADAARIEHEIAELCRRELPRHKVPAMISFVPSLAVAATGKLVRQHA